MKARGVALAAVAAILAGTTAALTADLASPGLVNQTLDTGGRVATMTHSDFEHMQPVNADRLASLLHIDETQTTIAPTVSRDVLNVSTIRKIGYGHVSNIDIVTTPSGVYSSDGVASTHVLYPGVESSPSAKSGMGMILALVGGGWMPLHFVQGGSFTYFGPGYAVSGKSTCVSGSNYQGCF